MDRSEEIMALVERLRRELKLEARRVVRDAVEKLPTEERRRLAKRLGTDEDRQRYQVGARRARKLFRGDAA